MNEQERFINTIKMNLPLDGKGGLSTLQLDRAKYKTNIRLFVDHCVSRKVFINDEIAQIQYVKEYLGKKNEAAKAGLREPLEQMASMILGNWRLMNFYEVVMLYSFKAPHPKRALKVGKCQL